MSDERPKISFLHWFVQNGNEAFTTEPASTDFLVTPASQASIDVPSWSQATTTSYALEPLPYATALDTSASTLETHLPPNRHVKHSKANEAVVSEPDPKVQDVCEKNPILLVLVLALCIKAQGLYNKSVEDNLKLEHEISDILFFKQGSKQCAGVACWEGFVSFISQPSVSNGVESIKANTKPSSHIGDIVSLDVTAKDQMASGSIDNRICFWTGQMPDGSRSKKGTPPVSIISIPRKNEFALQPIPVDMEVLKDNVMKKHKITDVSLAEARRQVEQNRHNSLTTTYYLTLKRWIR